MPLNQVQQTQVGSNNILEKDVTLLIAKELERTLRDTQGYRPVMIRDGDETVSLNDRYQRARQYAADILISVHADGFRLASVKGASVFIGSEEASSTVALNLSEKQRKRIQADIKNLKTEDYYFKHYMNYFYFFFFLFLSIIILFKPFTRILSNWVINSQQLTLTPQWLDLTIL